MAMNAETGDSHATPGEERNTTSYIGSTRSKKTLHERTEKAHGLTECGIVSESDDGHSQQDSYTRTDAVGHQKCPHAILKAMKSAGFKILGQSCEISSSETTDATRAAAAGIDLSESEDPSSSSETMGYSPSDSTTSSSPDISSSAEGSNSGRQFALSSKQFARGRSLESLVDSQLMSAYSNPSPSRQTHKLYFAGNNMQMPSATSDNVPALQLTSEQAEYTQTIVNKSHDFSPEDIFVVDRKHSQSGPHGSIVNAVDTRDGSLVDIQIIDIRAHLNDLFSLCRELIALTSLQHEGLAEYLGYYFQSSSQQLWIVARRPGGSSLADCLQSAAAPFSEEKVSAIVKRCLRVLQYLQGQNFTHRLLNASNVYVTTDGDVQLSCLGCCTATWSASLHRQKGRGLGHHYTSAPEIINRQPASAKADSWSLGVLAYELLQGRRPYHELQPTKALAKVARSGLRKFVKKVKVSSEMTNFLDRCLRKRPLKRAGLDEISRHPFLRKAAAGLTATSPAA